VLCTHMGVDVGVMMMMVDEGVGQCRVLYACGMLSHMGVEAGEVGMLEGVCQSRAGGQVTGYSF
jgi:hypothetical protein